MNPTPRIGTLPSGPRNAISDVGKVSVGHYTLAQGDIQTGVTVVLPHTGDLCRQPPPCSTALARASA